MNQSLLNFISIFEYLAFKILSLYVLKQAAYAVPAVLTSSVRQKAKWKEISLNLSYGERLKFPGDNVFHDHSKVEFF